MAQATFKLVEECSGTGELMRFGELLQRVHYRIDRYQGMLEHSGLPVPGLHRFEGMVDYQSADLVGVPLTLRLEDGRSLAITIDCDGRVLAEGHGPGRGCSCC